jgi:hypothetical protein
VTILGVIVLLLAAVLWIALVADLASMNQSDAAGNGLSYSFGVLMALALWVLLAVLLVIAGTRGAIPPAAVAGAFLLVPLSCWSVVRLIGVLRDRSQPRWLIAFPALIPVVFASYAVWAFIPAMQARVSSTPASIGAGAVILLLSVLWMPVAQATTSRQAKLLSTRETADGPG